MKQFLTILLAAVFVSSAALAQDTKDDRKQEMIKHRTDMTVKQYKLNDKQAQQLLELNTRYADKMRPPRHHKPHGPHDMKGKRPEPPKGDMKGKHPEPPKDGMKHKRPEMDEAMKAYDTELQKILTPDQYKNYKADMEKRHHDRQKRGKM